MSGIVRRTPLSTLNGPIGPHRRYAWASTTVDDIKTVRKGVGGTFNNVVLAAVTVASATSSSAEVNRSTEWCARSCRCPCGAATCRAKRSATEVTRTRSRPCSPSCPSASTTRSKRLEAISAQMDGLKESKQAVAGEALTSLSGFAPPVLLAVGTRLATRAPQRNVNTVTTNVPGPQVPLFAAGKRMLKAYPYVPLAGQVRVGVAIFSYDGQVNFGVTGDYDSAPDIDVLCRGIEAGMDELLAVAGRGSR